jgi:hypothetical protein
VRVKDLLARLQGENPEAVVLFGSTPRTRRIAEWAKPDSSGRLPVDDVLPFGRVYPINVGGVFRFVPEVTTCGACWAQKRTEAFESVVLV